MGAIAVASLREHDAEEGMQITKVAERLLVLFWPQGIDRIFLESPGCNQFLIRPTSTLMPFLIPGCSILGIHPCSGNFT